MLRNTVCWYHKRSRYNMFGCEFHIRFNGSNYRGFRNNVSVAILSGWNHVFKCCRYLSYIYYFSNNINILPMYSNVYRKCFFCNINTNSGEYGFNNLCDYPLFRNV